MYKQQAYFSPVTHWKKNLSTMNKPEQCSFENDGVLNWLIALFDWVIYMQLYPSYSSLYFRSTMKYA